MLVAPWCSGYHYCISIIQRSQKLVSAQIQILLAVRRFAMPRVWQWSKLEIRSTHFHRSIISPKQFINIIIHYPEVTYNHQLHCTVTFTEEILHGKLLFLCSVIFSITFYKSAKFHCYFILAFLSLVVLNNWNVTLTFVNIIPKNPH